MTRASDEPIDEIASDALDGGFGGSLPDEVADSVRSRTEEMARVRAMLRDDTDAPTPAEMSAMLSSALTDARAADRVVTESSNRAPWLAAAAAGLVAVLALSVVASGGFGSGSVDETATASVDDATGDAGTVEPDAGGGTAPIEEFEAAESMAPPSVEDAAPSTASGSGAKEFDTDTAGEDQAPAESEAVDDGVAPSVPTTNVERSTGASRFAGVRVVILVPLD